eukprot:TRINITY_DN4183_c0_g2_i1.p1 TRINITY_DN4183_c0_g2~~TRINITY_DN4183_c0_g2_i1.p1  ORF type:complete len:696 (-),score=300.27 TRINITY_DN4183_c0_g2_i1:40-2127(-)
MAKLETLFSQLDTFLKNSQYDQALETSEKILAQQPTDVEAFKSKIFSLIHLQKFDDVLNLLKKEKQQDWIFEIAYCYYRTKKLKESLEILRSVQGTKEKILLELEAQLTYRLEDYTTSITLYQQLINVHGVDSTELKTNLLAAYCGASLVKEAASLISKNRGVMDSTFEFAYNSACMDILKGEYASAVKHLKIAKKVCKENLEEEGLTDRDIEDELAILNVQLAYALQMQNKIEEATQIYNDVLKIKPSDPIVLAVASNNIVSLRGDSDLFDSSKKLKTALGAEEKLSVQQKNTIHFNHSLLLFRMNKAEQCREILAGMDPKSPMTTLLNASLLHREKKTAEALNLLKKYLEEHSNDDNLSIQLTLAQLHLASNDIKGVISILESIKSIENRLATVASLVYLYEQQKDLDGAIAVLDRAVDWWTDVVNKSKSEEKEDLYMELLKHNANFKFKHGRYEQAAAGYERILKIKKNDLEALPALIMAYSKYNPQLAEKYASQLPPLNVSTDADIETLENFSAKLPKYEKEKEKEKDKDGKVQEVAQAKKKRIRKKRVRLPKNFDPNIIIRPDPERWLPKHQRAAFRKKKRGPIKGGSQGTVTSDKDDVSADKTPVAQPKEEPQTGKAAAKAAAKGAAKGAAATTTTTTTTAAAPKGAAGKAEAQTGKAPAAAPKGAATKPEAQPAKPAAGKAGGKGKKK